MPLGQTKDKSVTTRHMAQQAQAENSDLDVLFNKLDKVFQKKLEDMKETILQEVKSYIQEEVLSLKQEVNHLKSEISSLEAKTSTLQHDITELNRKNINLEQYSRRKSIRILGMTEKPGENCTNLALELLSSKLDLKLGAQDIETAHRILSKKHPRPLIVKFTKHDSKMSVMTHRKLLKGQKVSITEDLCADLYKLMNRLQNDDRIANVWAWDSNIFAKRKGDGAVARVLWGQTFDNAEFRNYN